jgi:hypothetical protein
LSHHASLSGGVFAELALHMTQPADARRSRRYGCYGPIQFRVLNWQITGKLINLSLEGCLIRPSQKVSFAAGDTFELRFEVRGLCFRVRCAVRWVGPDQRLGVEILMMSERGRRQLVELLDELTAAVPPSTSDCATATD